MSKEVKEKGDSFLYIYLSLMLCIFSILVLANAPEGVAVEKTLQEPITLLADSGAKKHLVDFPFPLFSKETNEIVEESFTNILAIVKAHDVDGEIFLPANNSDHEVNYGQALALQHRFAREGITPSELHIRIDLTKKDEDETPYLVLYDAEEIRF